MHPDPVPISNIFLFDNLGKFFSACSIINSVSGLGISTFLSTLNLYFQKSLKPRICAIGLFCFLNFK